MAHRNHSIQLPSFKSNSQKSNLWFFRFENLEKPSEEKTSETESGTTQPTQSKKRRKGHDVQEDTTIDSEFAKELDLSCVGENPVEAPSITDAYILKYGRWVNVWSWFLGLLFRSSFLLSRSTVARRTETFSWLPFTSATRSSSWNRRQTIVSSAASTLGSESSQFARRSAATKIRIVSVWHFRKWADIKNGCRVECQNKHENSSIGRASILMETKQWHNESTWSLWRHFLRQFSWNQLNRIEFWVSILQDKLKIIACLRGKPSSVSAPATPTLTFMWSCARFPQTGMHFAIKKIIWKFFCHFKRNYSNE